MECEWNISIYDFRCAYLCCIFLYTQKNITEILLAHTKWIDDDDDDGGKNMDYRTAPFIMRCLCNFSYRDWIDHFHVSAFSNSMPDFFPHELNFCFFQCAHQGESALWFILLRSINSAMIKKDWIIFNTNQILVTVSFWIISWMPVGNIWYIYIAFMLITARWRWWCSFFVRICTKILFWWKYCLLPYFFMIYYF